MADWELSALRAHLAAALRGPLPGPAAQARLAPVPRPGWNPHAAVSTGRPAAVLALFYPLAGADGRELPVILYTVRTDAVETHRGQVSFPGGCLEAGETAEQAALREAHEETGIAPAEVELLGRLTPLFIPATGYHVTPVVGLAPRRPVLRRNPDEVERVIEAPLADLLRPGGVRTEDQARDGRWVHVRYFELAGARLWGATAMMTAELLALLGW